MKTQPGKIEKIDKISVHANYMEKAFADDLSPIIENFLDAASIHNPDTIIGTGLSGTLIVPTIARALGLKWAIVRKDNDGSHSINKVEGDIGTRWMFVDDFVSSGDTLRRVKTEVDKAVYHWNTRTLNDLRYYASSGDPQAIKAHADFEYFNPTYVGTFQYNNGRMYVENDYDSYDPYNV